MAGSKKFRVVIGIVIGIFVMMMIGVGALIAIAQKGSLFADQPIAVLTINGPIFQSDDILRDLEDLRQDGSIKAVVLRIDSPGGAVGPSQEIQREVIRLRKSGKIVIASMGTVAASGAYYISSAADHIVANSGTITGSVGVIMEMFGVKNLLATLMVEPRVIKSGAYKDAGSPFGDLSDRDRDYLQQLSDNLYTQFVRDVAKQRRIPLDKMSGLAEGKVYSGQQALDLHLIDSIGNFFDAIDEARKLAHLPVDAQVRWPKEPSVFDSFFGDRGPRGLMNLFWKCFGAESMPQWRAAGF